MVRVQTGMTQVRQHNGYNNGTSLHNTDTELKYPLLISHKPNLSESAVFSVTLNIVRINIIPTYFSKKPNIKVVIV